MKTEKLKAESYKLVLLDSHAIIHRAYHALPEFATSKGEPTGALYGLVAMLLKIITDLIDTKLMKLINQDELKLMTT